LYFSLLLLRFQFITNLAIPVLRQSLEKHDTLK
jgi:hypothetical protein